MGSWVAEVTIATANGALIKRYQALAGVFQRLRAARAKVKKFATGSECANAQKHAKSLKKLDIIERDVDRINLTYGWKWRPHCVGAFVVFNNEESRRRCIDDYSRFSLFQATPLRFRDKFALRVVPAPDPSQ